MSLVSCHQMLIMMNSLIFKERIAELVELYPRRYSSFIKADTDLFNWLSSNCSFTDYIPEMVYAILNQSESHICGNSNRRRFRTISNGWGRCATPDCTACDAAIASKVEKNNLKKYGVKSPTMLDETKKKAKETVMKNGGYDAAAEKRKQYYLDNYGVDHYWKTIDGQQKRKETLVTRYGAHNPSLVPELRRKAEATNLDRYGVAHAAQSDEFMKKMQDTCVERYGVHNPSLVPELRRKAEATNLDRYGVAHAGQSEELRRKAEATNLDRYGVAHVMQNEAIMRKTIVSKRQVFLENLGERVMGKVRPNFPISTYDGVDKMYNWVCNQCNNEFLSNLDDGKIPSCPECYPVSKSAPEQQMGDFLESLGVTVIRNSRSIISPLELDAYLPDYNVALELNGVYWHSETSGRKDKKYHISKSEKCENSGITLIHIWDTEWNNQGDIVRSRIKQKLGMSERIYARNCKVINLSSQTTYQFLDDNHIQGKCTSAINYGLVYDNNLVAVMTFGKSRFNSSVEYELLRYCSVLGTTVVGGAGKLLKYFERIYKNPSIISYCDLRWNTGAVYTSIGFSYSHTSAPNYYYFDSKGKLESRQKYQKHKLHKLLEVFDPVKTEWENMKDNGYDRIWDCGNAVFIKKSVSTGDE